MTTCLGEDRREKKLVQSLVQVQSLELKNNVLCIQISKIYIDHHLETGLIVCNFYFHYFNFYYSVSLFFISLQLYDYYYIYFLLSAVSLRIYAFRNPSLTFSYLHPSFAIWYFLRSI